MISQFVVGVSKTINRGNFQSIKIESSVTIEVDDYTDKDKWRALKANAQNELRQLMEETYKAQMKEKP